MGRGNRGNNVSTSNSGGLRRAQAVKTEETVEEVEEAVQTETVDRNRWLNDDERHQAANEATVVIPVEEEKDEEAIAKNKQEIEDKLREIKARREAEAEAARAELSEETQYEDELLEKFGIGEISEG